jgi:hypothetical protein
MPMSGHGDGFVAGHLIRAYRLRKYTGKFYEALTAFLAAHSDGERRTEDQGVHQWLCGLEQSRC